MNKTFFISLLALTMLSCINSKSINKEAESAQSIYDFTMQDISGNDVSLKNYSGKVILIVNTASKCGFTPQFEELEKLYNKYKDSGFVILGFPSNQFLNQDPGSNKEILEFCQANYGVTFPMFAKIDVNGENAAPLYEYLKSNVPNESYKKVSWNFNKFLIGKDGKPIKRFNSKTKPFDIEDDIKSIL